MCGKMSSGWSSCWRTDSSRQRYDSSKNHYKALLNRGGPKGWRWSTSQIVNEAVYFCHHYVEPLVVDIVTGAARDYSPTQRRERLQCLLLACPHREFSFGLRCHSFSSPIGIL